MNILKFIESFSTESLMNVKGSRRDIFSQVGLLGKNAALITIPFGIASVSTKASAAVEAQVRKPYCCITISTYIRILGR
jgi:hypothetical protein